jgi:hypothetical protein
MDIISEMRLQKAVYWAPAESDEYGRKTYADPVEIDCRWSDKQIMFRDMRGQEKVSRAVVYPDRALDLNGVLWLGELAGLTSTTAPFENTGAYEISLMAAIPTIDNDATLYKAIL